VALTASVIGIAWRLTLTARVPNPTVLSILETEGSEVLLNTNSRACLLVSGKAKGSRDG